MTTVDTPAEAVLRPAPDDETVRTFKTGMQVPETPKKTGKYAHLPQRVLFSLDGVDYTMPEEPPPNVVFAYLRDARRGGAELAFANMFVELVGEDALDTLADYTDMKTPEMKRLMKEMQKRVMGALELGN